MPENDALYAFYLYVARKFHLYWAVTQTVCHLIPVSLKQNPAKHLNYFTAIWSNLAITCDRMVHSTCKWPWRVDDVYLHVESTSLVFLFEGDVLDVEVHLSPANTTKYYNLCMYCILNELHSIKGIHFKTNNQIVKLLFLFWSGTELKQNCLNCSISRSAASISQLRSRPSRGAKIESTKIYIIKHSLGPDHPAV